MVLEDESDPLAAIDDATKAALDQALSDAFLNGEQQCFNRLLDIYTRGNVTLDYRVRPWPEQIFSFAS